MARAEGDFVEYLRRLGHRAEAGLGDHPDPETLLAYYREELPEPEAEHLAEHVTYCRSCANLVLAIPAFLETPLAAEAEPPGVTAAAPPAPLRFPTRSVARRWLPLAAALLVGLGAGSLASRMIPSAPGGPASLRVTVTDPGSAAARGDGANLVVLDLRGGRASVVAVLTPPGSIGAGPFRGRITSETGRVLLAESGLEPTNVATFVLVVPRGALPAGRHRVEIFAGEEPSSRLVGRWTIQVLTDP